MQAKYGNGEDERHGTHFQKGQHEKNRPATRCFKILREDHDGAAEAHRFPGDQQSRSVLQAKDAERAEEAHGSTKHPAPCAPWGRRCQRACEASRYEAEAHQP